MKKITRIIAFVLLLCLTLVMATPVSVSANDVNIEEYQESDYKLISFVMGLSQTIKLKIVKNNDGTNQERYKHVPLFNQVDYPNDPYGKYGSIASHGCGIVSLAMVATYLTDELQHPVDLATKYGHFNTENGSYWSLFESTDQDFGIDVVAQTYNWSKVKEALSNGQVVVALQGREGIFTNGGHYIVLTGITEDGKILVNDPNGANWNRNKTMIDGFLNGFDEEQITLAGGPYWIYAPKGTVVTEDTKS